jgi:hypothetical protein
VVAVIVLCPGLIGLHLKYISQIEKSKVVHLPRIQEYEQDKKAIIFKITTIPSLMEWLHSADFHTL